MNALADHWNKLPVENRTDWCISVLREYFFIGGMEKALQRELKKRYFDNCQKDTVGSNWKEYYHKEWPTFGMPCR